MKWTLKAEIDLFSLSFLLHPYLLERVYETEKQNETTEDFTCIIECQIKHL